MSKTTELPTIHELDGGYVIHFLSIEDTDYQKDGINAVSNAYRLAVGKAKEFGGRKYHCKSYGGGIIFDTREDLIACFELFDN